MDLSIYNIDPSVTLPHLHGAIASALQSLTNSKSMLLPSDFAISISAGTEPRNPLTGRLAFSSVVMGRRFMEEYGGKRPQKRIILLRTAKRLVFKERARPSGKHAQPKGQAPQYLRKRVHLPKKQSTFAPAFIPVSAVQFGWECRDNVYSVEYEMACAGRGNLVFDEEKREFRIGICEHDHDVVIVVRASQILWASVNPGVEEEQTKSVLFFSLETSPTYEAHHIPSRSDVGLHAQHSSIPRRRLSSLDSNHEAYSTYTSLTLRLVCDGQESGQELLALCNRTHIPLDNHFYPVVKRNIFSTSNREKYDQWLKSEVLEVAFQVEAIARANVMDLQELLELRPHLGKMRATHGTSYTASFTRYLSEQAQDASWYQKPARRGPVNLLMSLFLRCKKTFKIATSLPFRDDDIFHAYQVRVTPTRVLLDGPFPERNNRVMRTYANHTSSFLRVCFTDEEGLKYRLDPDVDGRQFVHDRFGHILSTGLNIAGRHFDFLGYSQSGLKLHAVWFVKEFQMSTQEGKVNVTTNYIISRLGEFHKNPDLIHCPARYAARVAQAFTSTEAAVEVEAEEVLLLDDIMDADRRRSFTDGAGLMSVEFADAIWEALKQKNPSRRYGAVEPDVYQFRFQGSKGTVTKDRRLQGRVLCLRPSMVKFEDTLTRTMEIAGVFNRPRPFFLNRPLVMMLEGLKIKGGYEILQSLQDDVIRETKQAATSPRAAANLLEKHGLGVAFKLSSVFVELARLEVVNFLDQFMRSVLNASIYHIRRDLKYRARIPVKEGYTLIGVADPYDYLREGEVYVCIARGGGSDPVFLEGQILVSRSPTIHPGDVQVATAVGKPPSGTGLASLKNCLVFSTKGSRPLPSSLGGGDLDGDVYVLTLLDSLLPTITHPPAEYDTAVRRTLDHPCTQQDIADFVTEFLYSDNIGIISARWLEIADKSPKCIFDPACLTLAKLNSAATDYPKTGLPVPIDNLPRCTIPGKPDWSVSETESSGRSYTSQSYLGRLFREVDLDEPPTMVHRPKRLADEPVPTFDEALTFFRRWFISDDPVEIAVHQRVADLIQTAPLFNKARIREGVELFGQYTASLLSLCASFSHSRRCLDLLHEEEVVAGTIIARHSQTHFRKERLSEMREQVSVLVSRVEGKMKGAGEGNKYEVLKGAWVAFRLCAIQPDAFGSRSYRLIALHEIFDALKAIEASESTRHGT